ncbi:MAG TPA: hypothetical protein VH518_08010, partial [Tepidisphaeraceae bacterium]
MTCRLLGGNVAPAVLFPRTVRSPGVVISQTGQVLQEILVMNRSRFFSFVLRGIEFSLLACLTFSASAQAAPARQLEIAACKDPRLCSPQAILGHTLAFQRRAAASSSAKAVAVTTSDTKSVPVAKAHHIPPLRYFVRDLGTLGGTESFAYALNNFTQIVGLSRTAGDAATHSFIYANGHMRDLAPLNSEDILTVGPTGINDFGQIAAGVIANGIYVPAILDTRTHQIITLPTLGGVTTFGFNGVAMALNRSSDAVGYSYLDSL